MKNNIVNIFLGILSNIIAFIACIYAIAQKSYWILYIMIFAGVVGVIYTAYLRADKAECIKKSDEERGRGNETINSFRGGDSDSN